MNENWWPSLNKSCRSAALSLAETLSEDIRTGKLKPGEKLPPQRELADHLGIHLSTVTRAFKKCEEKGLIHGTVGRGTFVTQDAKVSLSLPNEENNLIDMGQVLPFVASNDLISESLHKMMAKFRFDGLIGYGPPEGMSSHREIGAHWLNRSFINADIRSTMITSGSQNALTSCFLSLFSPGDRIAVDALTYPGIKSLAALTGLRLIPIASDKDGMSVEALQTACKNDNIRGIYLMPEFHNPTTIALPIHKREKLADTISANNLILLEDDAYSYTGNIENPPISTFAPDRSIFLSGMSKILGPGFRITFIHVPAQFRDTVKRGINNTTWMASPITAALVCKLIESKIIFAIMDKNREEAKKRNQIACQYLKNPNVLKREHGFFQWLPLPDQWSGQNFELVAREKGLRVFCAEKFAVGSTPVSPAIRFSLSGVDNHLILEKGFKILAELLLSLPDDHTPFS